MADIVPITLFFQSERRYSVDAIEFDLVLEENHSLSNSITSMNVEDGSDVNDHIKEELRTGSLTGKVTNFSIKDDMFYGNKALNTWEMFKQLMEEKKRVTIVCIMDVYEDVAVTNVSTGRNSDTGEAGEFSVSFEQMNVVMLEQLTIEATVKLSSSGTKTNQQSMKTLDKGKIITTGVQ